MDKKIEIEKELEKISKINENIDEAIEEADQIKKSYLAIEICNELKDIKNKINVLALEKARELLFYQYKKK